MKLCWIVEHFADENGTRQLIEEIKNRKIPCEILGYQEKGSLGNFKKEKHVIFQGSIGVAKKIKQKYTYWNPGVICNAPMLSFKNLSEICKEQMLNLGEETTLKSVIEDTQTYLRKFSGKFFIRPDSVYKPFSGQIISDKTYWKDLEIINFYQPGLGTKVWVAPFKEIKKREWRMMLSSTEIVTGCLYEEDGVMKHILGYPEEVRILANWVISKNYNPDPIYILDICETLDSEFKILEANAFSCSGLYACDPKKNNKLNPKNYSGVSGATPEYPPTP